MDKISLKSSLFTLAFMFATPQAFALKCWTTEDGTRACGDSVPPKYAQQGYEKKNAQGMTVERKEAARTIEDVEAEFEAQRQAEKDAKLAEKQARLDKNLLDTFASEDDMLYARDGQVAHLESQIKLTESRNEKLQASLDALITKAANHERAGNEPPESLVKDIESLEDQINANRIFIDGKRKEQRAIYEKFDNDIERFRKLSDNR
ncbi:MAG: hypothetical protein ACU84Q_00905 [Gammaproteobacteria bacterium]